MTATLAAPPARPGSVRTRPVIPPKIRDASSPLCWFVALLIGLPSGLVFAPLGAAGAPAAILGLFFFAWWVNARLVPQLGVHRGRQPIRVGLYAFQLAVGLGFLAGTLRPLSSEESSSSTRFLLSVMAWSGVTLIAADGIRTRASLDRLLKFVVWAGMALALMGLFQFFTGFNVATLIRLPGLTLKSAVGGLARENFTRVQGTAVHAIEFGVVLSMILPLAFHYAWFAQTRRRLHWAAVVAIGLALPLTVSRSAILGMLIVMTVLFASWPSERRRKVLLAIPFIAVVLKLMVPGLLGTLKGLFSNFSNDPSTQGRTDDYAAAGYYISHAPFFGRGISTFLPELYRTLDNAYLGWVIETGFIGLLLFLVFIVISIGAGFHVRRRARDDAEAKDLGSALAAGLLATAFNFGTFDGLGFAMCAGMFFLLIGATGALWRLAPRESLAQSQTLPRVRWTDRLRIPRKSLGLLAQTAGAAAGVAFVMIPGVVQTQYLASASVQLRGPASSSDINPYVSGPYLDIPSEIVKRLVMSPTTAATIRAKGMSDLYTVASGNGSLMPLTDKVAQGALILISVRADGPEKVLQSRDEVVAQLQQRWRESQLSVGSPPTEFIPALQLSGSKIPIELKGNKHKAMAAAGAIGFAAGGTAWYVLGTLLRNRARRRDRRGTAAERPARSVPTPNQPIPNQPIPNVPMQNVPMSPAGGQHA